MRRGFGSMVAAFTALFAIGCSAGTDATPSSSSSPAPRLTVGSKSFAESVILGEAAALLAERAGATVERRLRIGGTQATWQALLDGTIDVYVEYTGTLERELLTDRDVDGLQEAAAALAERGLSISRPLGFNNTYAIGMRRAMAESRGIRTISDLRDHPDLVVLVSTDFHRSADGWSALARRYDLPYADVDHVPHGEVYAPLRAGEIHVTDLYSTDAQIARDDLVALDDDLGHFPRYDALLLYRSDLERTAPAVMAALRRLEGAITAERMVALNARVALENESPAAVARRLVARLPTTD